MNYIRINKFSKVPLYMQLYDSIKAAIQSGQLKDKDKLPSLIPLTAPAPFVFDVAKM